MTNDESQHLAALLMRRGILARPEEAEALAFKAAHGDSVPSAVRAAVFEWLDWWTQPTHERELQEYLDSGEEAPCEWELYGAWSEANPVSPEVQLFLEERKREGALIDPETAEVCWEYGSLLDPYCVYGVPAEFTSFGREYYARRPQSEIWVSYMDLPPETLHRLREKGHRG